MSYIASLLLNVNIPLKGLKIGYSIILSHKQQTLFAFSQESSKKDTGVKLSFPVGLMPGEEEITSVHFSSFFFAFWQWTRLAFPGFVLWEYTSYQMLIFTCVYTYEREREREGGKEEGGEIKRREREMKESKDLWSSKCGFLWVKKCSKRFSFFNKPKTFQCFKRFITLGKSMISKI